MGKHLKRLIEVDLPIKRISAHARREKSIRHGHISTLHIWWARRPLAACRAVICAALWPDPADPLCPESFREVARNLMKKWAGEHLGLLGEESYRRFIGFRKDPGKLENNEELRKALLDFIADFANWDNSTRMEYLETSQTLTQSAHEALGGLPGTRPLVVDPFAGGGSIPLEALRVGADAFASDLNPVAVLLNKVVLEYIPKYGRRLAEEVRKWGEWIKKEAEKELAEFYPKDPDGATPIAYLWARTITCEGPGCGAEVPLIRSLWLAKKGNNSIALKMVRDCTSKTVNFEIIFNAKNKDVGEGTVRRGAATCPLCGYTTPVASVRQQLKEYRGGAADARLISIRRDDPVTGERVYRLANIDDINAYRKAIIELERRKAAHTGRLSLVPDELTPSNDGHRAVGSPVIYGMERWSDLFTPRQALTLSAFVRLVKKVGKELTSKDDRDLANAVQTCLALAVDRLADFNSSLCRLNVTGGRGVVNTFSRQTLPMVWDFMETNPFNKVGANWERGIANFEATISAQSIENTGHVARSLAEEHPLPDDAGHVFFTDPPYYDAVPYAEIADFFYIWLKRILDDKHKDLFNDYLTPKLEQTIVWHPGSVKEKRFFVQKMGKAMAAGRRITIPNGIGIIVFAHKSTSGWEAQLQAIIDAGWTVTGSWPIDTERPGRINSQGTASLASSIHLVCRPREKPDGSLRTDFIGDWRDVLQELPRRIHDWLPRLAAEGVVGADAIFACLGPALEIFSRYSRVEKASGEIVTLREYLEQVWAAVAREALNRIFEGADASGFEEDSRLTAMWLWTLSTEANDNSKVKPNDDSDRENVDGESVSGSKKVSGGYVLEYDAARKIAQGLGAHMEKLITLVEIKGNKARLLPVSERTRFLFDKNEGQPAKKAKKKDKQLSLFDVVGEVEDESGGWGDKSIHETGQTVLDRLHQCMILFAAGRGEALKRFLVEDGVGRDQRFWRLAQALSALYPPRSDEKRWVDGVLARKKGLGF